MVQVGILPQTGRIFAIGDLHGDYTTFITLLYKAKIVDKNGNWIAGKTILVQIGDVLDSKVRVADGKMMRERLKFLRSYLIYITRHTIMVVEWFLL